ncbi:hypothetical protein QUF84_14815 [Fictibacillus enclensis]|uniref:hypothetical protein n=1 Tax=Fictibacillus enclensis TaxID=1017270 RepID=UPI0025A12422|nr:hypothetical protein [Fictibacillus enclensis]MDM5338486.1 hypothetical protein [Fictibacillus enclensis]
MKDFFQGVTFKNFLDVITVIIAIINVYVVILVYKLTHKDVNPKLFVKPRLDKDRGNYGRAFNESIGKLNFEQRGLPEVQHEYMIWGIEVHNNGDLPATNVQLTLSITVQKSEIEEGNFEGDIVSHHFVDFGVFNKVFHFDYIPPNASVYQDLLTLQGDFPHAILKVESLNSTEGIYINKPTRVAFYKHPLFDELADSDDFRRLVGVNKDILYDTNY